MKLDIYEIVIEWENNKANCPICHLCISKNNVNSHFSVKEHEIFVNKLPSIVYRLCWRNLIKNKNIRWGEEGETDLYINLPNQEGKYKYKLIQKYKKESKEEEELIQKNKKESKEEEIKPISFEDSLKQAIEISKKEFEDADMQMFQIQLNYIELANINKL